MTSLLAVRGKVGLLLLLFWQQGLVCGARSEPLNCPTPSRSEPRAPEITCQPCCHFRLASACEPQGLSGSASPRPENGSVSHGPRVTLE